MAVYTVQNIANSGLTPTYAAVAASDSFANDGSVYLHVKNGNAASCTVTIQTAGKSSVGLELEDRAHVVAAGAELKVGPFDTAQYNDSNGRVVVTFSIQASVTAGAFRLP